jgi:hypothetical protein
VTLAASPPSRFPHRRVHRSFTMSVDASSSTKIAPRISAGDSPKNPVLASTDETPSRGPRKFIYCQKPRLRVRATRHRPAKVSRGDLHRASSPPSVNDGNIFSYSIYSDIDIR